MFPFKPDCDNNISLILSFHELASTTFQACARIGTDKTAAAPQIKYFGYMTFRSMQFQLIAHSTFRIFNLN